MQRRSLLKCFAIFFVAPVSLLHAAATTGRPDGIYLVDGWVLKASDLRELGLDAL
jgi:hypothetical protein